MLASGLTQTEAGARLRIAQSRLSDLMRNKWEKFSLEMLITLEARAGWQVTMKLMGTPKFEMPTQRPGF